MTANPTSPEDPFPPSKLPAELLRELFEVNLLGATLISVFYLVFRAPSAPAATRTALMAITIGLVVFFALTLVVSRHISRPLVDWVVHGSGNPPQRLQMAVVVQPFVQASVVAVLWGVGAIGFGIAIGVTATDHALRQGIIAASGTIVAGTATSALTYLRVEHTWRAWLPRFFPDPATDPTTLPLPARGMVAARLRLLFVLGTVLPLFAIAAASWIQTSDQANDLEQLVVFLALGSVLIAGILSVNIRRSITQPIHQLRGSMEAVARGELETRIPVDRADELGQLQRGFNEMLDGVRQREQLADLLGRQVGEAVAERALSAEDGSVRLGGETRSVTALFVDLAAFSTFAENLAPSVLAELLNVVFDVIVRAVERHSGLVNKFQGDAVLAIFGAPNDDPDHALHALESAASIAARFDHLRVDAGIGVASGEVFAGNVGSERRFEYTVIGDAVNQAGRLQDLTRRLDRRVLLNGSTAALVREAGGRFAAALVPIGEVSLRGRSEAVEVFSLSPQVWRGATVDDPEGVIAAVESPLDEPAAGGADGEPDAVVEPVRESLS